jgi:hypothetical protein
MHDRALGHNIHLQPVVGIAQVERVVRFRGLFLSRIVGLCGVQGRLRRRRQHHTIRQSTIA